MYQSTVGANSGLRERVAEKLRSVVVLMESIIPATRTLDQWIFDMGRFPSPNHDKINCHLYTLHEPPGPWPLNGRQPIITPTGRSLVSHTSEGIYPSRLHRAAIQRLILGGYLPTLGSERNQHLPIRLLSGIAPRLSGLWKHAMFQVGCLIDTGYFSYLTSARLLRNYTAIPRRRIINTCMEGSLEWISLEDYLQLQLCHLRGMPSVIWICQHTGLPSLASSMLAFHPPDKKAEEIVSKMSKALRRWTPHEDAVLRERVRSQSPGSDGKSINWNEIAKAIPGRSNKDCRKRFFNEVTGGLKKGPWSEDEDARLEGFVKHYGMSWALIAQKMGTRSADQCSKRWQHCLDPKLDHSSWTEQENQCLLAAVERHGTSWKEIQTEYFPLRSANNVKNQCTILERKYLKSAAVAGSTGEITDPATSDLDLFNHGLDDFHNLQNPQLGDDFTFSTDDFESTGCTDTMDTFAFDSGPEDASQPPNHENGYHMDVTAFHGHASRTNTLPTPDNSVSSSCPLARLGSRVPSFSASNDPQGTSNNNSCPLAHPITPSKAMRPMDLSPKAGSPCNSAPYPIKPQTPTPQAASSALTVAIPADEPDPLGLPSPANSTPSTGNTATRRGGFNTPTSKGTRTTITLEDAEPGTIMDVMKVLVSSNARVRFQTE